MVTVLPETVVSVCSGVFSKSAVLLPSQRSVRSRFVNPVSEQSRVTIRVLGTSVVRLVLPEQTSVRSCPHELTSSEDSEVPEQSKEARKPHELTSSEDSEVPEQSRVASRVLGTSVARLVLPEQFKETRLLYELTSSVEIEVSEQSRVTSRVLGTSVVRFELLEQTNV